MAFNICIKGPGGMMKNLSIKKSNVPGSVVVIATVFGNLSIFPPIVFGLTIIIGIYYLCLSMISRNKSGMAFLYISIAIFFIITIAHGINWGGLIDFLQWCSIVGIFYYFYYIYSDTKFVERTYTIFLILNISVFGIGIALGGNQTDISATLYRGSYHLVFWLSLLLLILAEYLRYSWGKAPLSVFSYGCFALLAILLGGRSGIILGVLIFIVRLAAGPEGKLRKSLKPLLFVGFFVFLMMINDLIGVISFYIQNSDASRFDAMSWLPGDLGSRGIQLGPRELIYGCFIETLTMKDLLLGFSIPEKWNACGLFFDNITRLGTESSVLNAFARFGAFAIVILYAVGSALKHYRYASVILFFLLFCVAVRALTADYLFVKVWDWVIVLIVAGANGAINNHVSHPARRPNVVS